MDENSMINDILGGIQADLLMYQISISEAENIKLRQLFQEIRDSNESFQYELFKIAESKGYYKTAEKATIAEISNIKSEL